MLLKRKAVEHFVKDWKVILHWNRWVWGVINDERRKRRRRRKRKRVFVFANIKNNKAIKLELNELEWSVKHWKEIVLLLLWILQVINSRVYDIGLDDIINVKNNEKIMILELKDVEY